MTIEIDAPAAKTQRPVIDVGPELVFDDTAQVFELYCVAKHDGEEVDRKWIGAFDTRLEARDGWHYWISSGQ